MTDKAPLPTYTAEPRTIRAARLHFDLHTPEDVETLENHLADVLDRAYDDHGLDLPHFEDTIDASFTVIDGHVVLFGPDAIAIDKERFPARFYIETYEPEIMGLEPLR